MESLSRPRHGRKHSTSTNVSSSFSLKNPYDGVSLSRGDKAKFEPREYAEIFSGSSSIPVLNLSGLNEPARAAGCRSSELDYSNIFGGARDDDVAVSYEQLFKKTRTRMPTDTEQEHGSLNSLGKAKRSLGANGVSTDGIKPQLNMSFNKTSQRSINELDGKTHIAQLHAVPGFAQFIDGTPQLQKKEDGGSVPSMKRGVSRTWSFQNGIDATTLNGGLSPDKSHAPDNSCNVNGINLKSHISKVRPPSGHPSGSNDNKDIKHSSLSSFASKETSGENSPPLFDEELDENSDAAVSIAALKKAIEQAQESIRLAKMIMQKRKGGIKDGSRARRSKGPSEIEVKMENKTEHASGGMKKNNVKEKDRQLDPKFRMFTGVDGRSAANLMHTDKFLNAQNFEIETVRENFEAAHDREDAFIEAEKKFAPSCSQSGSLNTDKKVELGNVRQSFGASKPLEGRANVTGSLETVVLESRKVDCNDNLICSRTKAFEQREPTIHQSQDHEVISGGAKVVTNSSQCALELEHSPKVEAVELCQVTVSPIKRLAGLAKQLERALSVSVNMQEQEITHGGGDLRISQKDEQKFVGHEELYDFTTLQNESLSLTDKSLMDQEDINKQPENVSESKEEGQDGNCSNEDRNGTVPKEEILWFESELQLEEPVEEEISEREPGIFPGVGEVATKVEPEMDDEKLNFELENDSKTVPGEHEDNITAIRCIDAASCEAVETIQIGTNNDSVVQNCGIPIGDEELNGTDGAAGRRKKLEDDVDELNDSASGKGSSEAFAVHSNDPSTIFRDNHGTNTRTILSENPEPCDVTMINAEKYVLSRKAYITLAVQCFVAGKKFEPELNKMKVTEGQLNNTAEGFSPVSKSTSDVFTDADHEKVLPNDEDMFRTTTEIRNTAEECASKTNEQNCPEQHVSTNTTQVKKSDDSNVKPDLRQNLENSEESQSSATLESIDDEVSVHESPACTDDATDISSDKEEVKGDLDMNSDQRLHAGQQSECLHFEGQTREMDKSVEAERHIKAGLNMEKLLQNLRVPTSEHQDTKGIEQKNEISDRLIQEACEAITSGREREKASTSTSEDRDTKGVEQKSEISDRLMREACEAIKRGREREKARTSTSEHQDNKGIEQKSEVSDKLMREACEAIKRGREREKDRIAVDRVIREARERAFAEARERAERAAVEKATAEARQKVEVREKTVKTSVETKPSADKASIEAKLRAERAAVERATAEARERALEKAMSQKTSMRARVQATKYSTERPSSSSTNNGLKHSFSSSDTADKFDGANSESAQRRKARLERHQRIMERAAKALAEKNMRDLLAQKEQAERNRLAESLDADIKRWASGKEGNLRALLSTLQYVLGSDSGWKPLTLTEIVTTSAVKKAYRKATLCVHPDKLQQRGASIQQKYVCEKIFDLLKAAWNRFNSEEN